MLKLCHSLDDTHTLYRQEQKNNSSKLNRLNINNNHEDTHYKRVVTLSMLTN